MLNDEEDGTYHSEENTTCVGSWPWSLLLDPMTGGTCAGGTAGGVACSTGASCNTTFAVGIGFWAGVPAAFCSLLACYKICSGDTTPVRQPLGTDLCVNKVPSLLFNCCHEKSTGPSTSSASPRELSSTSSLTSRLSSPPGYGATSPRSSIGHR